MHNLYFYRSCKLTALQHTENIPFPKVNPKWVRDEQVSAHSQALSLVAVARSDLQLYSSYKESPTGTMQTPICKSHSVFQK